MAEQTKETRPMTDQPNPIAEQIAAMGPALRQFQTSCAGAAAAVARFNRDFHDAMNWAVSLQVLRAMARKPADLPENRS